jgi:hypothetical protein
MPDEPPEEQLVALGAIQTLLHHELAQQPADAFCHPGRDGFSSTKPDDPVDATVVALLQSVCDEVGLDVGMLNWAGVLDVDESDVPIATLPPLPTDPCVAPGELLVVPAPSNSNVSETTTTNDEEEKWLKYAQKRVGEGGVAKAVLKQSYRCQQPGCLAIMVTEKNTHRDGPHAPTNFVFHGAHNHSITSQLQDQMANASYCDYAYTGGRLKRRPRPY